MELDLGAEIAEFRAEMRAWIQAGAPEGLRELTDWRAPVIGAMDRSAIDAAERQPAYGEWDRRLQEAALICPQWPVEVGGRDWTGVQVAVFAEECHRAGVPRIIRGMGERLVGPAILVHGTPEQKARLLPRIISGEDVYCQGFSEPDNGSDLGGLTTRGTVEGDEVVIHGQKVWTSRADLANMMFVLCRTDPEAPKHAGLSYVLVPIADNNIDIRPLRQISGAAEFCQEYIDGARAPLSNVIGGVNNGWRVAMTTLGHERGGRASVQYLAFEREFWDLVATVRERGRAADPVLRQQLAWAYTRVQVMKFQGLRLLSRLARGQEPGPEASIDKLAWSEYHRSFGEIAVDVLGLDALVRPGGAGYRTNRWQDVFLTSRADTIYSGANQIQRSIIAERVLGLPR